MISLQNEGGTSKTSQDQFNGLFDLFVSYLKDIAVNNIDRTLWFDVSTVTLSQIQAKGKRIAIYADNFTRPADLPNTDIYPNQLKIGYTSLVGSPPAYHEAYEFISSSPWYLDSHWFNVDSAKEILKKNLYNLDSKKDNRKIWLISQFNLTL